MKPETFFTFILFSGNSIFGVYFLKQQKQSFADELK